MVVYIKRKDLKKMVATNEMTAGQLRILKAVATLLENPANKITVQRIAQEIHVTDGAIYRHYKSKDEIFEAIAAYMESNILGPLNVVPKQTDVTAKRLELVFEQHMAFLEGHPGLARLFLGGGSTEATPMAERLKLLSAKVRAQLAQLLKFGEAQGALVSGMTPEQAVEMLYGFLVGTAVCYSFGLPQVPANQKWKVFATACLKEGVVG
ncbi:MAG: TetR family transcriptional regulator [Proteobacteria bacterium]|nr:TetR family transcriptional regulator [Pseudomonadota bacterium]